MHFQSALKSHFKFLTPSKKTIPFSNMQIIMYLIFVTTAHESVKLRVQLAMNNLFFFLLANSEMISHTHLDIFQSHKLIPNIIKKLSMHACINYTCIDGNTLENCI